VRVDVLACSVLYTPGLYALRRSRALQATSDLNIAPILRAGKPRAIFASGGRCRCRSNARGGVKSMARPELRPGLPEHDKSNDERVTQDSRPLGYVSEVDEHVLIQPSRGGEDIHPEQSRKCAQS
jgi:hypothetical protein